MKNFTDFWCGEYACLTSVLLTLFIMTATILFSIPDKIHVERPIFILVAITIIFLSIEYLRRR